MERKLRVLKGRKVRFIGQIEVRELVESRLICDTNPNPGQRADLKKRTQRRDNCLAVGKSLEPGSFVVAFSTLIHNRLNLFGPVGHPCG